MILLGASFLLTCGLLSLASEIELHPREILPPIVNKSKALPCIHREKEVETMKFIPSEMEKDIELLINNAADYVTYDKFFRQDYLEGLLEEMLWLEENYKDKFIDSKVKRNFGEEVPDGQYKDYHRYSDVFWLTFIKKEHENQLPHTMYFKEWIWLLRAAINKKLPEGFEVAEIEE